MARAERKVVKSEAELPSAEAALSPDSASAFDDLEAKTGLMLISWPVEREPSAAFAAAIAVSFLIFRADASCFESMEEDEDGPSAFEDELGPSRSWELEGCWTLDDDEES